MPYKTTKGSELKAIGYELFIGALSILSIGNLLLLMVVADPNLDAVLQVINIVMFPIFPVDFVYRFVTAESRSVYFSTVGYGDRFPVSNWGRIVGIFVMTAGVGLFATLSGFLANKFLTRLHRQRLPSRPVIRWIRRIQERKLRS